MPDEIVDYLNAISSYGGMSKQEARELLSKHGLIVFEGLNESKI